MVQSPLIINLQLLSKTFILTPLVTHYLLLFSVLINIMQKALHNGNTYDKSSYRMTNDDR
jgi:hypothetical protein